MNFFEHQQAAKKKTWLLITLLILSVISLITISILILTFAFHFSDLTQVQDNITSLSSEGGTLQHLWSILQSPLAYYTAFGIIYVIGVASIFEFIQLKKGGSYIAQSLGGKLIISDTHDLKQKRVLNVVEEMAIASGNRVPNVYLLPDKSINAFAAGNNRQDAIIGITQGALDALTRDELQGVIAHEFSHIHNGDTQINMRLIAFTYGLIVIGVFGKTLMDTGARASLLSKNDKRGANPLFILGIALFLLGYLGQFFSNIIKAAVSRQREFLADASAVQFTRNPGGISGALKKIGGLREGSHIRHPSASRFSHLFFNNEVKSFFSFFLSTHPPLKERITRIEPNWDKSFIRPYAYTNTLNNATTEQADNIPTTQSTHSNKAESFFQVIDPLFDFAITAKSINHTRDAINQLPQAVYNACHEPCSARAAIYTLLLSKKSATYQSQIDFLSERANPITMKSVLNITQKFKHISNEQKFLLLEIAMPALKLQSDSQKKLFIDNLLHLLKLDTQPFFEWCLIEIIKQSLSPSPIKEMYSLQNQTRSSQYLLQFSIAFVRSENEKTLSIISDNTSKPLNPTAIFHKAWRAIELKPIKTKHLSSQQFSFYKVEHALKQLRQLKPLEKPKLIKALMIIFMDDKKITDNEKAFFRAVCDALNCPVAPLSLDTINQTVS